MFYAVVKSLLAHHLKNVLGILRRILKRIINIAVNAVSSTYSYIKKWYYTKLERCIITEFVWFRLRITTIISCYLNQKEFQTVLWGKVSFDNIVCKSFVLAIRINSVRTIINCIIFHKIKKDVRNYLIYIFLTVLYKYIILRNKNFILKI